MPGAARFGRVPRRRGIGGDDHVRAGQAGERTPVGRQFPFSDAGGSARGTGRGLSRETLQDPEEGSALEKGEVAGAEVVEHGAERFGADCRTIIETPGAVEIEGRR